jgi:hypothetical protein
MTKTLKDDKDDGEIEMNLRQLRGRKTKQLHNLSQNTVENGGCPD